MGYNEDWIVYTDQEYQRNRDLLASVENLGDYGSSDVSKYGYGLDTLGRRTSAALTGLAFYGGSGDHHWDFGYNDRSELTSADCRHGTTPGTGTLFSPQGPSRTITTTSATATHRRWTGPSRCTAWKTTR